MSTIVSLAADTRDAEVVDDFRTAMSLFAGGVTVITAGRDEARRGLTATAVCSLSLEPPSILVCINRNGATHDTIMKENAFCVNVLAKEDLDVANQFAGRAGPPGADKFADAQWVTLQTGAPALQSGLVAVDCEVYEAIELNTHTIFLGRVRDVLLGEKRMPLLHYDRQFCSVA